MLEESVLKADVEFNENEGVIGQYVSATSSRSFRGGYTRHVGFHTESRQLAINNGRRRIGIIAAQLRQKRLTDQAHRLFILAVQRNFIQGGNLFSLFSLMTDYFTNIMIYI